MKANFADVLDSYVTSPSADFNELRRCSNQRGVQIFCYDRRVKRESGSAVSFYETIVLVRLQRILTPGPGKDPGKEPANKLYQRHHFGSTFPRFARILIVSGSGKNDQMRQWSVRSAFYCIKNLP
uniref:GRAS domain-containing protein n=1 Tax=Steinernema glaseri TaxID=37863 RepID=A0A1I7YTE0_9BILA